MQRADIVYDTNGTVCHDVVVAPIINASITPGGGQYVKTGTQAAIYGKAYRIIISMGVDEDATPFHQVNTGPTGA